MIGIAERRSLARYVGWLIISTIAVMILGSLVRATDSGLACPDWPLCFNKPIPWFDFQIFLEWFHRLLAGGLGIGLVWFVMRVARRPLLRSFVGPQLLTGIGLFVVQVILGGMTVLELLDPTVVSLHLINATLFLSVLIWIYAKARFESADPIHGVPSFSSFWDVVIRIFPVAVLAQILLGGMVSTNEAGLVCPTVPLCFGKLWPNMGPLVAIQMAHRIMAVVILALAFLVHIGTLSAHRSGIRLAYLRFLPTLVGTQIVLGLVNVMWALPTWASVAHLGLALIIFTSALMGSFQVFYLRLGDRQRAAGGQAIQDVAMRGAL